MKIKTSTKIITLTYIKVISHVNHFWFTEVDIRKKVVHLNHFFVAGRQCVTQNRRDKTYEEQAAVINHGIVCFHGSKSRII